MSMCRPNMGCCSPVPPIVEADSCSMSGSPSCVAKSPPRQYVFPKDDFVAEFPEFSDTSQFPESTIARIGKAAHRYITDWKCNFPLPDVEDRQYALFLMTAHLLSIRKNAADNLGEGAMPAGGRVRKAVVGAVTVETDIPSSTGDFNYFLSQTAYGQELLAYLENAAPAGIYTNCWPDTVRVL